MMSFAWASYPRNDCRLIALNQSFEQNAICPRSRPHERVGGLLPYGCEKADCCNLARKPGVIELMKTGCTR